MSNAAAPLAKKPGRVTLRDLHAEVMRLRDRVEDLEDIRELNTAIERNKGKKLVPWSTAKP